MKHLLNDHEDHPNQHKNSHKLCAKTRHSNVSLTVSQWKLRHQHDQNLPMKGKQASPCESQSGIQVTKLTI